MYIREINTYHSNSFAALLKEGELIALVINSTINKKISFKNVCIQAVSCEKKGSLMVHFYIYSAILHKYWKFYTSYMWPSYKNSVIKKEIKIEFIKGVNIDIKKYWKAYYY